MTIYAIGDIHGHLDGLLRLLEKIHYGDDDELWFVGDFINRGPQSAAVLRFLHQLPRKRVALGNHDVAALVQMQRFPEFEIMKGVAAILAEADGEELLDRLRQYQFLVVNHELKVVMSHAGIYPGWSLEEALRYDELLVKQLQGPNYRDFLRQIYGDEPCAWPECQTEGERFRFMVNAFCRMRYLRADGALELHEKRPPAAVSTMQPWFHFPRRCRYQQYFGHWASLGDHAYENVRCLDGGFAWGGRLIAWNVSENRRAGEFLSP